MERYCSTGQTPQRAVVLVVVEEEGEEEEGEEGRGRGRRMRNNNNNNNNNNNSLPLRKLLVGISKRLNCRSQRPRCLRRRYTAARLLRSCFESHRGHGRLSVVCIVCYQVDVSATS
jgi:hypothetical protein